MPRRLQLFILAALLLTLFIVKGLAPPSPTTRHTFGHGGPTIVLVHGLGSSASHWLPVARHLARNHRVTMVDLPGHGLATMPTPFSLEQATLALDRALAEEGEPVILVGHSLGGLVAASEALHAPRRVLGLVLVETALKPQIQESERAGLLEALDEHYEELVRSAYLDFGRDSAQGERLWNEVRELDPHMVKQWIHLAWIADLSEQIRELLPPLYAVVAERSWAKGESWEHAAAALGYEGVRNMRVTRMDGCGHFPMLDRPEDLARIIERFAANPEGEPIAGR